MTANISKGLPERIKKISWLTGIVWTAIVFALFFHDVSTLQKSSLEMARLEAAAHFNMDWATRLWATSHGGVYVPVTEKTQPNPFLNHVPERDITTPSGKRLTLMNPAYMIRQLMEHYSDLYGVLGRITSLKPLRSETSPDEWERAVLASFEKGAKEAQEVADITGKSFFRVMKPLLTEKECLKCHGGQGYEVGDVRGGLSVSVPLDPYVTSQKRDIMEHAVSFTVLWLLGLGGVAFFSRTLRRQAIQHEKMEQLNATVVENSLTGIYIIQEGKIVFANKKFANIYGYPQQELIGMDSLDLVHPDDRPLIAEMRQRRMEGGEAPEEYEARGRKKNGERIWVQRRNAVILHEGRPAILGNALDVTSLKKAEKTLREYARELEQKNVELDNFASIASHDLQEPLRKVKGFSDLLMSKLGKSLDEQSKDYIRRMQRAAGRMQTLISSLLVYSRVTTKAQKFEETDLEGVVQEALSNLEARIHETEGKVEVTELPTVRADRLQMVQLFQNLVGNALKFHRQGIPPHVKVYSRIASEDRNSVEICVEDNGIGFDEKYLDRIFSPFERLQGRGEYEGVGMGLAICRKIVESHRGQIAASSTPGEGSIFKITLPVQ